MSKCFRSLQNLVTKKHQMISIQNEIQMMLCTHVTVHMFSAQTLFFLYIAPRMSFRHQILQAPKTFGHNHTHKVSDFFEMFCEVFLSWVHRGCNVRGYTKTTLHVYILAYGTMKIQAPLSSSSRPSLLPVSAAAVLHSCCCPPPPYSRPPCLDSFCR